MKSLKRYATLAGLAAILSIAGCDDGLTGSEPRPGQLTVSLTTSHHDDGALILVLRGNGIESIAAVDESSQLFSVPGRAEGELRVAVIGEALSGSLIRIAVRDVNRIESFTADLVEVANESNDLREDLSGYRLVISGVGS